MQLIITKKLDKVMRWIIVMLTISLILYMLSFVSSIFNAIRYSIRPPGGFSHYSVVRGNMLSYLIPLKEIFILFFLREIFISVARTKEIFTPKHVALIKWIGYVFLLYAFLERTFAFVANTQAGLGWRLIMFNWAIDLWGMISEIIYGLVILGIAMIFEYGVFLQKENDLTV